VLPQHLGLFWVVVFLIFPHFLQLVVADDTGVAEQVFAAVGDDLDCEVESHSLQQSLPCDFVEPIKLESEREQVDGGEAVLD
jgi:hypothetical protein